MKQEMITNINKPCFEYIPFHDVISVIIMCKHSQIPSIYYGLDIGMIIHLVVEEAWMFRDHYLPMLIVNQCTNVITDRFFFNINKTWIQSIILDHNIKWISYSLLCVIIVLGKKICILEQYIDVYILCTFVTPLSIFFSIYFNMHEYVYDVISHYLYHEFIYHVVLCHFYQDN